MATDEPPLDVPTIRGERVPTQFSGTEGAGHHVDGTLHEQVSCRLEHPRRATAAAKVAAASGGHPGAVRAERHRVHRAVVLEPDQLGPGGRLEHPRRPAAAAGVPPAAAPAEPHPTPPPPPSPPPPPPPPPP